MKNLLFLFFAGIIITLSSCGMSADKATTVNDIKGTIRISGDSELCPLVQKLAEEFGKDYKAIHIEIVPSNNDKGISDVLSDKVEIAMVSRPVTINETDQGVQSFIIAKNAFVPIINAYNPELQKLMNKGLSKATLLEIYIGSKTLTWGDAVGKESTEKKIQMYKRVDACSASELWTLYLGTMDKLSGIDVLGEQGMFDAVKKDTFGIGYCSIDYAYTNATNYVAEGIKPLPIDFNSNGKIDDNEYFYQKKDSLINAVLDGRFPSPPAQNLYFVLKEDSENELLVTFIKWVLSDGQQFIKTEGFIPSSNEEIISALEKLKS